MQHASAESGSFARSRLRLLDHVVTAAERHNPPLLDGRRLLETWVWHEAKERNPRRVGLHPAEWEGSQEELFARPNRKQGQTAAWSPAATGESNIR